MSTKIEYTPNHKRVLGDVLDHHHHHIPNQIKVIIHICNNENIWGNGFVIPLGKKYPFVKEYYLHTNARLGDVQFFEAADHTFICNMIAQDGVFNVMGKPPIRYNSLEQCLIKVQDYFLCQPNAIFHMPKIGCGIAGGDWRIIHNLIKKNLSNSVVHLLKNNY